MAKRAILFDSGGVLIRPVGGRWNPRIDFEEIVLAHAPDVSRDQFAVGIAAGERLLARANSTPDRADYHRLILGAMGVEPTDELLADLDRPVEPTTVVEIYPDVPGVLAELRRRGIPMAVVSDAWPSLPDLHAALGIAEYFDAYAISAVLGCNKPDPRIFHHASDALGIEPTGCLFVDDDPALVQAAINLGYHGRALRRDGRPTTGSPPSITTLTEVLRLV